MEGQTNTLTKRKKTIGEIVIDKTLHRKLKIEKHEFHKKNGEVLWMKQ